MTDVALMSLSRVLSLPAGLPAEVSRAEAPGEPVRHCGPGCFPRALGCSELVPGASPISAVPVEAIGTWCLASGEGSFGVGATGSLRAGQRAAFVVVAGDV